MNLGRETAFGLVLCLALGLILLNSRRPLNSPTQTRRVLLGGVGATFTEESKSPSFRRFDLRGAVQLVTPDESSTHARTLMDIITGSKLSQHPQWKIGRDRMRWKYLTPRARTAIDAPNPTVGRWKTIVLHASASRSGSAALFEIAHRRQRGMAYHFVIGNGTYTGGGEIEVGNRWTAQQSSESMPNEHDGSALAVCLVGDFNALPPSQAQVDALAELLGYLRAKVGSLPLLPHRGLDSWAPSCPGRYVTKDLLESVSAITD